MYLTSVKMTESEDQSMEPDLSGSPFLGQEPNPVQKVEEGGVAPRSWMCKSYGLEECSQRLL